MDARVSRVRGKGSGLPGAMNWIQKIVSTIINIFNSRGHGRRKAVGFEFKFGLPKKKDKTMPTTVSITNEQKVKVTLKPVTETGKPAKLDGKPAWTAIAGNSQVVVADDGLSADLISSDTPGET